MDQFNESKNFMSFLSIYTDKISDNNMELMIFIVIKNITNIIKKIIMRQKMIIKL